MRAIALILLTSVCLTSCGIGFRAEWARAARMASTDGLAGRWEGTWLSDVNGHTGTLKCIVPTGGTAESQREFLYRATWMKILAATLSSDTEVKSNGKAHSFKSEKDLGMLGGTFRCTGEVKGDEFHAKYTSYNDQGTFTMRRVP